MDLKVIEPTDFQDILVEYPTEGNGTIYISFDGVEYRVESVGSRSLDFYMGNNKISFWKNMDGSWEINTNTYFANCQHVIKLISQIYKISKFIEENY